MGSWPRSNLATKFKKTVTKLLRKAKLPLTFLLVDQDGVTTVLLGEGIGVLLEGTLGAAEGGAVGLARVRATLKIEFAGKVRANILGGSVQAKGRASGFKIVRVLRSVALGLGRDVLLLRNQVVNALFKFHLNQL